jgi:hypothetical protein
VRISTSFICSPSGSKPDSAERHRIPGLKFTVNTFNLCGAFYCFIIKHQATWSKALNDMKYIARHFEICKECCQALRGERLVTNYGAPASKTDESQPDRKCLNSTGLVSMSASLDRHQ